MFRKLGDIFLFVSFGLFLETTSIVRLFPITRLITVTNNSTHLRIIPNTYALYLKNIFYTFFNQHIYIN